jgi:hypothetical protein
MFCSYSCGCDVKCQYGQLTATSQYENITLLSLLFTQIIIPGILWVRAKNYLRLMQETDAVRSDASVIFLMGNFLRPEELNDSGRKRHIRERWIEVSL